MIRNRKTLNKLRKFDAFPKMSEKMVEQSTTGGTVSLISFAVMGILIIWETGYYLDTTFTFNFKPTVNIQESLSVNLDMTVAMHCNSIGVDLLDVTGQNVQTEKTLKMEDVWYELDPYQKNHFESVQNVNSYLREEYHSIHRVLWKNGYISIFGEMPVRRKFPKHRKDGCRIHGSLVLNQVAGSLHVTAGKTLHFPSGHAHLAIIMEEKNSNFSHRIEKFSFGDHLSGMIHPLEGDEHIAASNMMSYQYFLTVVPTKINTYRIFGSSYQYSVSHQQRLISHDQGSHGTAGIFFKYDFSALQVEVREEHASFTSYLLRLIGIVGGIYTCSGMLHRLVGTLVNCVFCRYFRTKLEPPVEKVPILASLDVNTTIQTPILSPVSDISNSSVSLS